MYNSRVRRTNYEGYPEGFAVPENYSGNAFRETPEELVDVAAYEEEHVQDEVIRDDNETVEVGAEHHHKMIEEDHKKRGGLFSHTGFGFNIGNLFGSIGFEELLIIGLILLIAQKENNEDIIVLLALILFIG